MANSPRFKIYDQSNEYVASCKYPEHAAMLISGLGNGATIRIGHRTIVWAEGSEEIPAGESFDLVAQTVYEREATPMQQ